MHTSTLERRKISKGSAILESTFIFLVFFCMLIGTFDFGQFLFIHQALVERSRSATRWGAVHDAPADQVTNMVLYGQSTDPGSTAGYFNLTTAMVDVTKTTDSVCTTSGAFPSLYKRVTVKIHDYPYQILSPYIAGTYNGPNITIGEPIFQDFSSTAAACP
jgi:hypothetical protein